MKEYELKPGHYGRTLEIDHIVALELGGSNDIANLFPEKANAQPGYKAKDKLENALARLVCQGALGLRAAQTGIAANWQRLYKKVFGTAPVGRTRRGTGSAWTAPLNSVTITTRVGLLVLGTRVRFVEALIGRVAGGRTGLNPARLIRRETPCLDRL